MAIVEQELSYQIMQAAFEVYNKLGPGFLESLFENAMVIELRQHSLFVETQVRVPVLYKNQPIGEHILDVIVNSRVILELKAVSEIAPIHKQQALSYAKATSLPLAIVINFGASSLQYSRVANTRRLQVSSPTLSRNSPNSRNSR